MPAPRFTSFSDPNLAYLWTLRLDSKGRLYAAGGSDAKVLRSIPLLDAAALDAVRQWQFTPTTLNGQAVPVIMTVTVNFTLQ